MSSINNDHPHVLVLPEDRANEQIVNGFLKNPLLNNSRAIRVLPIAGGWKKVVEQFTTEQVPKMRQPKLLERRVVLLIDFDDRENRFDSIKREIPDDLKDRVFLLGTQSEPEKLRTDTRKSFEKIGETLATECAEDKKELWAHDLLKHNNDELERLNSSVKPFLFSITS